MLPSLSFPVSPSWYVPDEAQCVRLWDKYGMMPHIREHCRAVASVALEIVRRAGERGLIPEGRGLDAPSVLAAGLLHDIAKTYTIRHGGSHAQLGAAWVRDETSNPALAQAVLWHVSWPWQEGPLDDSADPLRLPIIIAYADKRVRHTEVVTLEQRFEDLLIRYGIDDERRERITGYLNRTKTVEKALFDRIGVL
ncbi:HD domain-containing protein [Mailhella sp.]